MHISDWWHSFWVREWILGLEFCSAYVQDAADVTKDIVKLELEPEVLPPRARSHLNSGLSLSLSYSFFHYYVPDKDACNHNFSLYYLIT